MLFVHVQPVDKFFEGPNWEAPLLNFTKLTTYSLKEPIIYLI